MASSEHPSCCMLCWRACTACLPSDVNCEHCGQHCKFPECHTTLMQAHIASLETTEENRTALLMGLEYLLNISFVDDDEVGGANTVTFTPEVARTVCSTPEAAVMAKRPAELALLLDGTARN